jgi:hypothetical protein
LFDSTLPITKTGTTDDNGSSTSSKSAHDLSRPQRKAIERQRKAKRQQQSTQPKAKTKHKRSPTPSDRVQTYSLHSNAISQLNINSTADNVVRAIKRAQNLHDSHDMKQIARFLLEQTDSTFFYGFRGSLLARLAVAALHMNQTSAIRECGTGARVAAGTQCHWGLEYCEYGTGYHSQYNAKLATRVLEQQW